MTDAEKLVIRHGGVRIPCRKHKAYVLDGQRFTFHSGGISTDRRELRSVRSRLRKMGKIT